MFVQLHRSDEVPSDKSSSAIPAVEMRLNTWQSDEKSHGKAVGLLTCPPESPFYDSVTRWLTKRANLEAFESSNTVDRTS
jgi:hypothetical protein